MEKNTLFEWTATCQQAFDNLRNCLMTSPVLAYPDYSKRFVLDTDASDYGIGAVLSQVNDDKSECVVAYASRYLTRQEQRYCVTRRELLAIVEFTQHFRQYLLGRKFTLRTDHGSLVWIQNFKEPEGQVARWLERLAEYNFKVVHRRGTKHNNADALSRHPCKQCGRSNHLQGDIVADEPVLLVRPFQTHSTGEIYQLQMKDPAIRPVYVTVKKGKLPHDDEISVLWENFVATMGIRTAS